MPNTKGEAPVPPPAPRWRLALYHKLSCTQKLDREFAGFPPASSAILPTATKCPRHRTAVRKHPMSPKVWIDGKLFDKADAKLSVYDHGLLYGDGVFEGIRVYNGKIFECDAHIRRLYDSAKAIRLKIPPGPAELKSIMEQTVKANGFNECYIRVVVTRGVGWLGLDP